MTRRLAPDGMHAASSFAFYLPIVPTARRRAGCGTRWRERIVAKIASVAPNFPDLIDRQLNYPAYTYELMFGCTGGDFTPRAAAARIHGPLPARAPGWPDNPVPVEGLYLCGAGCHGGPGVTFIPGYNCGYAVLDGAERPVVAQLALHERQEQRHGEGQAGEEAHDEEDPGPAAARAAAPRRWSTVA